MASSNKSYNHRRGGRDRDDNPQIALSKALSWLLRHNAEKEGLKMDSGGWVDLGAVLSHSKFASWTVQDVKDVVAQNDKQRFSLRHDKANSSGDNLQIRANQGHSIQAVEDEQLLQLITDPATAPTVIHGTYLRHWDAIRVGGLSRMSRRHIHFAPGEQIGSDGVISGMRSSSQIHIYVDIAKAMQDGLKFYRSENNVILSPGDENGFLKPIYFLKVLQVKTKKDLLIL